MCDYNDIPEPNQFPDTEIYNLELSEEDEKMIDVIHEVDSLIKKKEAEKQGEDSPAS